MMMEKAALLLFCCLLVSSSGFQLDPSIRFGRRDTSILMTSSVKDPDSRRPPWERAELRSGRHAHAIFTNSYRKVLGQISARKFLQTIMGKRLGDQGHGKRRPDLYQGTYKERLTSIQSDRGYSGVHGTVTRPRLPS